MSYSDPRELRPSPELPGYWADREGTVWEPTPHGLRPAPVSKRKDGYVSVRVPKRPPVSVHRVVCAAFHGEAPTEKAEVLHLNHTPGDNRPENLAWGDRASNSAHSKRDGRYRRGERHHNAKLSDADVHALKVAHSLKVPARALAERWGIGVSHVHALVSGRRRKGGDAPAE